MLPASVVAFCASLALQPNLRHLPEGGVDSVSLFRSRIAHPLWIPAKSSGWRVSQVRLRGCCAAVVLAHAMLPMHRPADLLLVQCIANGQVCPVRRHIPNAPKSAQHTSRPRATCTQTNHAPCMATSSPFTRNILTIPSTRRGVKPAGHKSHGLRIVYYRPSAACHRLAMNS